MSQYQASLRWERGDHPFVDNRYLRRHEWSFDGGITLPASSSPSVVPAPLSDPAAVDPEEAFVAALSSCHMLWFLSLAAGDGWVVDRYEDEPVGTLAKQADGRLAMQEVRLRPRVKWRCGRAPSPGEEAALHDRAHNECFLARSVRCAVVLELEGG